MRPPYPEAYQDFQADLGKRFTEYGRSVGMKMAPDFQGFIGQVPREFAEKYRGKAKFLEVRWVGFEPPGVFIHPDDPLYLQVAKAYAEEYLKRFGTDHLWASQSYCEMRPGTDPKETLAIEIALSRKNLEAIRSVDPKAVLFTNSWTFLDRTRENAMAFLAALPADAFQVWEMPSDLERGKPMYQQFDYYGGKPWLLGFLYAYGGTTMLHGDLADMIRRAQAAADRSPGRQVPRAVHRAGGDPPQPDRLRPDLPAGLGPGRGGTVRVSGRLRGASLRRRRPRRSMVRCFRKLTESVYGSPGVDCPLYMLRVTGERLGRRRPYGTDQAQQFLPPLQDGAGDRPGGSRTASPTACCTSTT